MYRKNKTTAQGLRARIAQRMAFGLSAYPNCPIWLVSLSSGASSAVAAQRAIDRYGRGNVRLVFMDTLVEHPDNYRFLADLERRWGPIEWLTDGRTPFQVWEKAQLIPNSLMAPCTKELKIKPFVAYCKALQAKGYHVNVIIGYNSRDAIPRPGSPNGRLDATTANYAKLGINVEYPLLWTPVVASPKDVIKIWGLEPPMMYALSFTSANCHGACPKAGVSHWRRVWRYFPSTFAQYEAWEMRMQQDARFAGHTILKYRQNGVQLKLSLRQLREDMEATLQSIEAQIDGLPLTEQGKAAHKLQLIEQQWIRWGFTDDIQQDSCVTNECGIGHIDEYVQLELFRQSA